MSAFPRIGYVPIDAGLRAPGDRRRFVAYAQARNIPFELAAAGERYDLVVLTEAADISVWPDCQHGKVVYDLIDSYLSVPRTNWRQLLRGAAFYVIGKHRKFRPDYLSSVRAMCRRADAVVCSTQEQRATIREFCDNVHVVLDVHSTVVSTTKADYTATEPFRIVWEGLATNLSQLIILAPVVRSLSRKHSVELHVVTDPYRFRLQGRLGKIDTRGLLARHFDRVKFYEWNEATCAEIMAGCDLAVIPIDLSDPFVSGKPENKLLLLWRIGLPVIAAATPAYCRATREAGMPDLACESETQWISALEHLITNETARRNAGIRGWSYAEEMHGAAATLARWDAVFSSLGFSFGPDGNESPKRTAGAMPSDRADPNVRPTA